MAEQLPKKLRVLVRAVKREGFEGYRAIGKFFSSDRDTKLVVSTEPGLTHDNKPHISDFDKLMAERAFLSVSVIGAAPDDAPLGIEGVEEAPEPITTADLVKLQAEHDAKLQALESSHGEQLAALRGELEELRAAKGKK